MFKVTSSRSCTIASRTPFSKSYLQLIVTKKAINRTLSTSNVCPTRILQQQTPLILFSKLSLSLTLNRGSTDLSAISYKTRTVAFTSSKFMISLLLQHSPTRILDGKFRQDLWTELSNKKMSSCKIKFARLRLSV